MKLSRVGVDLAKNVYQLHGVDEDERAVYRRRLKRDQWLRSVFDNADSDCHSSDIVWATACDPKRTSRIVDAPSTGSWFGDSQWT
jgi:hypothetical protein